MLETAPKSDHIKTLRDFGLAIYMNFGITPPVYLLPSWNALLIVFYLHVEALIFGEWNCGFITEYKLVRQFSLLAETAIFGFS